MQQQHEVSQIPLQLAMPRSAVPWLSLQVAADARPKRITLSVDRTTKVGRGVACSINLPQHRMLQLSTE